MGLQPGPELGDALARFIQEQYLVGIADLIEQYQRFGVDSGKAISAETPSYQMFDIVSNECRNVFDHFARCHTEPDRTASHVRMAEWHMDLAQVRLCQAIVINIRDILKSIIEYISLKDLEKISTNQMLDADRFDLRFRSALKDIVVWIRPLEVTKQQSLVPPTADEMKYTREVTKNLRRITNDYADLVTEIRSPRALPPMHQIRTENKRLLRKGLGKKAAITATIAIAAGIAGGMGKTIWDLGLKFMTELFSG